MLDAPAWRCRISLSLSLSSARASRPRSASSNGSGRAQRAAWSSAPSGRVLSFVFSRRRRVCARGGFLLPGVGLAWCRFLTGGDGSMSARRSVSMALVWLCAAAGGLLLWSAPALAQREHAFSFSFGSEGTGDGQFVRPGPMAVNEATHDVYVIDWESAQKRCGWACGGVQWLDRGLCLCSSRRRRACSVGSVLRSRKVR